MFKDVEDSGPIPKGSRTVCPNMDNFKWICVKCRQAGGWVGLGCGSQGDWLWTGLKRVFGLWGWVLIRTRHSPGPRVSLNRNQTRRGRRGTKAET